MDSISSSACFSSLSICRCAATMSATLLGVVGLLHHVLRLVGELRVAAARSGELVGHAAREAERQRADPRSASASGVKLDDEVRLGRRERARCARAPDPRRAP